MTQMTPTTVETGFDIGVFFLIVLCVLVVSYGFWYWRKRQ